MQATQISVRFKKFEKDALVRIKVRSYAGRLATVEARRENGLYAVTLQDGPEQGKTVYGFTAWELEAV